MSRFIRIAAIAGALLVAPALRAQDSPPAPAPRVQSDMYVPLYGVTAGISIPLARLSEDHGAGYALGGLLEYAVAGQPYSLRGDLLFQRFPLKSGHTGDDLNLLSVGTSIVYRVDQSTGPSTSTQTFVIAGISIDNATKEGVRPGFNLGSGVEIPLTGFSAVAEVRARVMLADTKPLIAIPLTVSVRF